MTEKISVYRGENRRAKVTVADVDVNDLIERVAQRAAELSAEKAAQRTVELIKTDFYSTVGRGVMSKLLWVLGVLAVTAYFYIKDKGLIK